MSPFPPGNDDHGSCDHVAGDCLTRTPKLSVCIAQEAWSTGYRLWLSLPHKPGDKTIVGHSFVADRHVIKRTLTAVQNNTNDHMETQLWICTFSRLAMWTVLTVILSVTGSIKPLSSGIFHVCELLYQIDRMKRGSEQLSAHTAAQCAGITGRKEYISVLSGRKVAFLEQLLPHCSVRRLSVQIFILVSSHCRFSTFRHRSLTTTYAAPCQCWGQEDLRAHWHLCHHLSSLGQQANQIHLYLQHSPSHSSTKHQLKQLYDRAGGKSDINFTCRNQSFGKLMFLWSVVKCAVAHLLCGMITLIISRYCLALG